VAGALREQPPARSIPPERNRHAGTYDNEGAVSRAPRLDRADDRTRRRCQPSTNHGKDAALKFPGHPASVWARQDVLLERILDFFAHRVIGPNRHEYARQESAAGSARQTKLAKEAESLNRAIDDLDRRRARLVKQLDEQDDPDGTLFKAVRDRLSEISAERDRKLARLAAATEPLVEHEDASDLLDALGNPDVEELRAAPEELLRQLFDAFRLTVTYDGRTRRARCRVVVSDDTLPGAQAALTAVHDVQGPAGGVDGSAAASDAHAPRASAACSYANGALGRIRTFAPGSGGRCSIP
jgi:hypothetical protein